MGARVPVFIAVMCDREQQPTATDIAAGSNTIDRTRSSTMALIGEREHLQLTLRSESQGNVTCDSDLLYLCFLAFLFANAVRFVL